MKDKELIKITKQYVKGFLGNKESKGMCFIISSSLQSYLSLLGFKTKLIEGEIETDIGTWNHFWLELSDGRILDPTSDQFNSQQILVQMPKVHLGEKPAFYKQLK